MTEIITIYLVLGFLTWCGSTMYLLIREETKWNDASNLIMFIVFLIGWPIVIIFKLGESIQEREIVETIDGDGILFSCFSEDIGVEDEEIKQNETNKSNI